VTGIRLGPLAPLHRPHLEAVVRATGVFSTEEVAVALALFDQAIGRGEAGDYEFVGAFDAGGTLIGYACYGPTPATDGTFDLYWIAVHPDAQRSGAGAALMAEVERRLSARRARLLVVETSSREAYAPTRRFYDRLGYATAAQLRDFYGRGDHRVILTKQLAS
jgi:ribosomal protein S18 acetylase RimI-like enzyme